MTLACTREHEFEDEAAQWSGEQHGPHGFTNLRGEMMVVYTWMPAAEEIRGALWICLADSLLYSLCLGIELGT